ncbi:MAG TPA: HAD family hydrolase [Polyangiaceae bacterium]|nr:HAD family hydrolase [Polyangiaceae bacterium]
MTLARLSESNRVQCARCGTLVDPLRADRVAIYGERFRYFCSESCHQAYDPRATATPLPITRERARERDVERERERDPEKVELGRPTPAEDARLAEQAALRELALVGRPDDDPPRSPATEVDASVEPGNGALPASPASSDEPQALAVGALLLTLAAAGGSLAIALALAGSSPVAITARLVLAGVALCALTAESWMGERDATELSPMAVLVAPVGGVVVAICAYITASRVTSSAVTLAAFVVASTAIGVLLARRARRPIDEERQLILQELDGACRRVVGDDVVDTRSIDLRPGEEIVLEAGDVVPVDATVSAGNATVEPWRGANGREERREGDVVVAGARVIEGRLRAVVSWAGPDRAWVRLSSDPHRRADLYSSLGRAGRLFAERLSPFLTGAAALAAFAGNLDWVEVGVLAVAVHASLTSPALAAVPAMHVARAILAALRRGIAFRAAEAFDRAGKVSTLAFCARGTLLLGEPEVSDIEAFGGHRAPDVLALVAGAESGSQRATATAIQRAARARGVRPDGVRSPNPQPGLGTTAVASNGQALVVGSRALMLREHVSVAAVESRLTELEAMGRSVLLVALGGRLIGLLGLQDGMRAGARAAVQHLLDIGIEPVLLSGDARETCEALGHALDIDHIRPELPPGERGDAIRRLMDGGAVVAVLGRSPVDDLALSAGDVSIALSTAGSTSSEWNVQLASDDVRDAAFALRLAHDARREARLALLLSLVPAAVGSITATLGLAAPVLAPLGAALGGAFALVRLRTSP